MLRRVAIRAAEGPHQWGGIDVSPGGRGGWRRTRLVVFPPGTNAAERRRLSVWRAWPVVGAFLAILVLVALAPLPQLVSFSGAAVFYLLGFVGAAFLTRRIRSRVRTLAVSVVAVGGGVTCNGDARLLQEIVNAFADLDDDANAGHLSPVAYEARWADLYDRLPEL
ncbi:MAG: hypothetical protein JWP75_2915 [Frondihabitans sp.]|nr:hypothetical protein [Frondihabitans sp.]